MPCPLAVSTWYKLFLSVCLQLSQEEVLKFYRSMTLLNTMDRILYESQRQVCGDRLVGVGASKLPQVPYLCLG
jgi:hypothetical protein